MTEARSLRWNEAEFKGPNRDAPWWLLNFYLELPFYMPDNSAARFNVSYTQEEWADPIPPTLHDAPYVLLHLIQKPAQPQHELSESMQRVVAELVQTRGTDEMREAFSGDLIPAASQLHIVSVVEAITPKVMLRSEIDSNLPHHPGTYLERCLRALNVWLRSIAVATRRPSTRTISIENLPMFMVFFHQRPGDGAIVQADLLRAHENPPGSMNEIATKHAAEQIRRIASSTDDTHGMFRAAEWHQTAIRLASVEGRHDLAVVALNTALEVLIFALARLLLVDEGWSTADIDAQIQERLGLATVCHRFIEPRVGGRWDASDLFSPLGEVTKRVVDLRNRVAHGGASVSPQQSEFAAVGFGQFTSFVTRQVREKRWRFRRAFMDLVNTFGAPSDITMGERFSKAASDTVKTTPKYWLPPNDSRQTKEPPVLVHASPGMLPTTARRDAADLWETTTEPFMHLEVR